MSRLWKDLRTNAMYWRFRYVTRNRLRLRSTWYRWRQPRAGAGARPWSARGYGTPQWRERGTASYVYRSSGKRVWAILLIMVAALTGLSEATSRGYLNGGVSYALSSLVVVAGIYTALRTV